MSAIHLTDTERCEGLKRFGYSAREAAFLSMAALHAGYFLRRHYAQFLGTSISGRVAALIEKTLVLGHAEATTFAGDAHIYHLCARPFFAALGQEDNRNRRSRQPATIRRKLMALDYVLAHPEQAYLATEQEKVAYFQGGLGLDPALFPAKRYVNKGKSTARYFVEKYPLFLSPAVEPARPPVPSFCYIDDGFASLAGLETFLQQYAPLWSHLPAFHVIYVSARERFLAEAPGLFERFQAHLSLAPGAMTELAIARLLTHFEWRKRYDARDWEAFDRAALLRFRDERSAFSGERFEVLYRCWKQGGESALRAGLSPVSRPPEATFSTYRLVHHYDLFGRALAS